MEHNRWKIKELLERKIGGKKSKIDWSLIRVIEWNSLNKWASFIQTNSPYMLFFAPDLKAIELHINVLMAIFAKCAKRNLNHCSPLKAGSTIQTINFPSLLWFKCEIFCFGFSVYIWILMVL